jgi:DNA-binding transcriptional ArsR family regulator
MHAGYGGTTDVFYAVADPTRRALLDMLGDSERSVTDLLQAFKCSQPAISQHLRVLREAGLVDVRQVGRQRLYRLRAERFEAIYSWAAQYRQLVDPSGHVWGLAQLRDQTVTRLPARKKAGRRKKSTRKSKKKA